MTPPAVPTTLRYPSSWRIRRSGHRQSHRRHFPFFQAPGLMQRRPSSRVNTTDMASAGRWWWWLQVAVAAVSSGLASGKLASHPVIPDNGIANVHVVSEVPRCVRVCSPRERAAASRCRSLDIPPTLPTPIPVQSTPEFISPLSISLPPPPPPPSPLPSFFYTHTHTLSLSLSLFYMLSPARPLARSVGCPVARCS